MTIYERRLRLLDILKEKPGITISKMAIFLGVSPGTVRNDIDALSVENKVLKVRGGAVFIPANSDNVSNKPHNQSFFNRINENINSKRSIAQEAVKIIKDGDSILLDASTTVFLMNEHLLLMQKLRVVTNCLETAKNLAQNPTHTIMLVGGIVRSGVESVTGPWADQFLEGLCTRYAFVSCSGFTPEIGMSEIDIFESQFRLKAIQSANQVIALVDSSKFGEKDLTPSIPSDQITHLYTDSNLNLNWQSRLRAANIPFTICQTE